VRDEDVEPSDASDDDQRNETGSNDKYETIQRKIRNEDYKKRKQYLLPFLHISSMQQQLKHNR
jgi:hypothetical protein